MRFLRRRAVVVGVVLGGAALAALPAAGTWTPRALAAEDRAPSSSLTLLTPQQAARRHHEFYFTRAVYSGGRSSFGFGGGRSQWDTDWPKADEQFMVVLSRLIDIDNSPEQNAVRLDDPNIRRFPFLYALEVGSMGMTEAEVIGLRTYLEAGGFLVIDDFWGPGEFQVFQREIGRVLPGREIYEIPKTHAVFNNVYDVANVVQVPNIRNGQMHEVYGTPTWECNNGCETPRVFGIDDDRGELMVMINWNTDIGDAWEWAENPYYPLRFSTYAFEIGVNMIIYAMSH